MFGNPGTTETTFLAALAETDVTYMLALHESSATGIAAGYAMITERPAILSLHTSPGLANGMFNLRNALCSGIPILCINGTEDSRFLIHNPPLGGPNTQLAETATKYQYEARSIDEVSVALQRCYLQASLQPLGPVFLSIPMDFMQSSTERVTFKKTLVIDDAAPTTLEPIVSALKATPKGKLAIVADYAVAWGGNAASLTRLAEELGADIYSAPMHVQGVVDNLSPSFKGVLPSVTGEIREVLSGYDTLLLVGDKIDAFTWKDAPAVPPELRVIQITAATNQLGFDWPVDMAVVGDVRATLQAIAEKMGADRKATPPSREPDMDALRAKYPTTGKHASSGLILALLEKLDRETHLVTEGSSEDHLVQDMAGHMGFRNVHYSPRGGGLGWAMPLSVGISLAQGKPALCFVGDGGSMFSIHAIWTAARHKIPVVMVCFVNHEYRLLKELWVNFMGGDFDKTQFVGLDFNNPSVDVRKIAEGFGAKTAEIDDVAGINGVLKDAFAHDGPTFIIINREP